MQRLTTTKTLSLKAGEYFVEEFETESYERHSLRQQQLNTESPDLLLSTTETENYKVEYLRGPRKTLVIEPLRTWLIGPIEGDIEEICNKIGNWLGPRKEPLTESDFEELRAYLFPEN